MNRDQRRQDWRIARDRQARADADRIVAEAIDRIRAKRDAERKEADAPEA